MRVLIVMPTWVGDCVMATPTLRGLRRLYPDARITAVVRRNCKPLLTGLKSVDRVVSYRPSVGVTRLARRLRRGRFDLAVILPGSFKSALLVRLAGVPRRVGYDRDGRGFLLTDKLAPPRDAAGKLAVTPTLRYYLKLVEHLGGDGSDRSMELAITPRDRANASRVLAAAGVDQSRRPRVILNPGASYGAAKLWPPQHFAELSDRLQDELGARVLVSAGPGERGIVTDLAARVRQPFADLSAHGLSLGGIKALYADCDLVVTGDTGPRHVAAALGTPLVTLFGPTDPGWTTLDFAREVELYDDVFCRPCQLKTCPIDHRCMTRLSVDRVYVEAARLLGGTRNGVALDVLGTV